MSINNVKETRRIRLILMIKNWQHVYIYNNLSWTKNSKFCWQNLTEQMFLKGV